MHDQDRNYLAIRYYHDYRKRLKDFMDENWTVLTISEYYKIEREIKRIDDHVEKIRSILN